MCRLEGIHGVVVHGVEFALPDPVEDVDGQHLEQDVDKARVVLHVHWQAVIRNLTDDPGATTSTHVDLRDKYMDYQEERSLLKSIKIKYLNLLGHSAALHSNVTSRVTNADDHHPLPVHVFGSLVVPAVKECSLERLDSFNTGDLNLGDRVMLFAPAKKPGSIFTSG